MTTANLAAIFQPGILSHPDHDMAPAEYRLSQDILIFLIENQDHFLIGMHGTAADEKTVRDVQSAAQSPRTPGTPTTPQRSKTVVGRSASNASAGADSIRKFGGLRRNVSVSSKTSKLSAGPQAPVTPTTISSITVSGGLGRSNTVPSKRSGAGAGAGASPRFAHRERGSETPTPSPAIPPVVDTSVPVANTSDENTPVAVAPPTSLGSIPAPAPPEVISASSSEATTPLAVPGSDASPARLLTARELQIAEKTSLPSLISPSAIISDNTPAGNATSSRAFLDIFKPSPTSSEDGRKDGRRKLQKKRIPGSALSSAQSSAHSLEHGTEGTDEQQRLISPVTPSFDSKAGDYMADHPHDRSAYATAQTSPRLQTPQRTQTDSTLRPTVSPSHSYRSHTDHEMTDASDADYATDATHGSTGTPAAEAGQKKRRWRISQTPTRNKDQQSAQSPPQNIANLVSAEQSKSTVGSSGAGSRPRRSFQEPSGPLHSSTEPAEGLLSDSEERRQKGPMSWIRGKIAERKERQDRARSPNKTENNASRQSLALEARGKSIDIPRQLSQASARSEADRFAEVSENDVQKPA